MDIKKRWIQNYRETDGNYIYIFGIKNEDILYVGETASLKARIQHHLNNNFKLIDEILDKDYYIKSCYLGAIEGYERAYLESVLIQRLNPKLNRHCNQKFEIEDKRKLELIKILENVDWEMIG
ncbi:GIY-YIG nuclease family protein [uncultured Clostridium sp.]|uniref:GIY-YIG nuclease family protein n=1 Tax=uncultured Clostridium sp. TaxID=59620 RepID=UPI00263468DB|nr:GIY-YIG nuclease family protein [uncultured Clostridium sp.]